MLRLLTLGAALALLAAAAASAGGTAIAFVALPDRGELVALDVGDGHVLRRIRVPHGVREVVAYHDFSRRRDFVLVASPTAVTLVDAFSQRVVKTWRDFGEPSHLAVNVLRGYVTDRERGQLVVLDLRSHRVVARIPVGARPRAVAVGDVAVVAHDGRSTLTLVDPRRRTAIGSVPAGGIVGSIAKQPDTANVYVTYRGSGAVGLVDWGRRVLVFRRPAAGRADGILGDAYHGRLVVADRTAGSVRILSHRDGRLTRTLDGCTGAHRVAQVGTASIIATCQGSRTLAVWDTTRWRLRSLPLGGVPAGVAVAILP